jgi:hypothetical protein
MNDAAQLYQKLLEDAIRKQITILGPQITLLKARNVKGLTVTDDGKVAALPDNAEDVVTRFLEEFRDISSPLVKKTMQPLLSAIGPSIAQAATQPIVPPAAQPAMQPKLEIKPEEPRQDIKNPNV